LREQLLEEGEQVGVLVGGGSRIGGPGGDHLVRWRRRLGLCPAFFEQLPHASGYRPGVERLRQHAVAAGGAGALLVDRLERAAQQQYGDVRERRDSFHVRRHLVAVGLRGADVGEDDVGRFGRDPLQRGPAVADTHHLHVTSREGQFHDAANRDAVVHDEELVGHRLGHLRRSTPTRVGRPAATRHSTRRSPSCGCRNVSM